MLNLTLNKRITQNKSTLRYHWPPVRLAKTQKFGNTLCCQGCGGERNTLTLLVGVQTGATPVKGNLAISNQHRCKYSLAVIPL